ncbi:amidase domain-containing protein [Lutispora thermophila]|uniref:Putative amidase domain-containing protein n=1 Tax=Lutispora thermophila DSM 19022 TaxID=1122184 RepID=A0A1M6H2L5_9FIRM|nr:amidase domain-containing protein [Lutispora thermophila]SHJ16429.1 Putative amidase domain-containing protein [Lutispora thermophila DSM 19022]
MMSPKNKMNNEIKTKFAIITVLFLLSLLFLYKGPIYNVFNSNEEIKDFVQLVFEIRNKAIIESDLESIEALYAKDSKYGRWAYEYEVRKLKYIHNWEQKQGVKFTEINPKVVIKNIKKSEDHISVTLLCNTEYKYVYEDKPDEINVSRIGTYHILDLVKKDDLWFISKEWYNDPFADSLNLDSPKVDSIKEFILSQGPRDFSSIGERRKGAVEYADRYCGAASEEHYGYQYNKKYRNYNSQGGDCANFASQILHEGGKFKKTYSWNYDKNGATRAWLNAQGFKDYMISSGRASLIAYGSYEKVYKASYKLLPGDFVAYEKKGKVTHISVVTGADSKGYALVTCHNTDRNRVPWDLGWSNSNIRFWLVRVHF